MLALSIPGLALIVVLAVVGLAAIAWLLAPWDVSIRVDRTSPGDDLKPHNRSAGQQVRRRNLFTRR